MVELSVCIATIFHRYHFVLKDPSREVRRKGLGCRNIADRNVVCVARDSRRILEKAGGCLCRDEETCLRRLVMYCLCPWALS